MADVADILLGIGDYVIGANQPGESGDVFQIEDTEIVTDSRVTYTGDRFSNPTVFGFPVNTTVGSIFEGNHFFWPTFWIADVVPVPEPSTPALFGLGLGAIGFSRRRRKTYQTSQHTKNPGRFRNFLHSAVRRQESAPRIFD